MLLRSILVRSNQSIELYSRPLGLKLYDMKNQILKENIRQIPKDGYTVINCNLETAVKASHDRALPRQS